MLKKDYSEILCKAGIVIIFVVALVYLFCMFLRWFQKSLVSHNSIRRAKNKAVLTKVEDQVGFIRVPPPPSLQFFGRSRSETIAINVFATILYEKGYDWQKIIVGYRPKCLKNPKTGRCMEIDAFFPDLNLGIEYNGVQHYKFPNHLHEERKEFEESLERDKLKLKLAREHNIKIISIPYYVNTCKLCEGEYKYTKNTDLEKWSLLKDYLSRQMIFVPKKMN